MNLLPVEHFFSSLFGRISTDPAKIHTLVTILKALILACKKIG